MKSEITKYFELHKNENTTYHNLCIWTELNVKVIGLDAHIRKEERNQIPDFGFNHKKWEGEQIKSQVSRRKEIKMRALINGLANRKIMWHNPWNQKHILREDE